MEEAFSPALEKSRQAWDQSICQTPSESVGQPENPLELDDTPRSAYYSPELSVCRSGLR